MIFRQKLTAIATIIGISIMPLPAFATEVLLRVDCLSPSQGAGTCEIRWPNFPDSDISDVTWSDGAQTRISMFGKNGSQRWNPQNKQWVDGSSIGFCWDRQCIHLPPDQWKSLESKTTRVPIECSNPTLRESTCQMEYVRETDGVRVYWPDGSIEHYRGSPSNNRSAPQWRKWSHSENRWIEVENWGMCLDKMCLLFDSDFLKK
jgi:hypothetical protein